MRFKWALLILIILFGLHDLKSATLFERCKATISDNSSVNNTNHISFNDLISETHNNNKIQIFDNKISTSQKSKTNKQQTFVADISNKPEISPKPAQQVFDNKAKDIINSSYDSDNNNFKSITNLRRTAEVEYGKKSNALVTVPEQYIFNYVNHSPKTNSNLTPHSRPTEIGILKTSEKLNAAPKVVVTDSYSKYNATQNEAEESRESVDATEEKSYSEEDQLTNVWEDVLDVVNLEDFDYFMHKYSSDKDKKCFMHELKEKVQWWAHNNGTLNKSAFQNKSVMSISNGEDYLDFAHNNITNDELLYVKTWLTRLSRKITIYSAAYNNLTQVPFRTLSIMRETLKRLNLKGNRFLAPNRSVRFYADSGNAPHRRHALFDNRPIYSWGEHFGTLTNRTSSIGISDDFRNKTYQKIKKPIYNGLLYKRDPRTTWATFPIMPNLMELDISNCNIEYLDRDVFVNITGLRKLYLSHNNLHTIQYDTFHLLRELEYLDLSYINLHSTHPQPRTFTRHALQDFMRGVKIHQNTFKNLNKLVYLDISHAKLAPNSGLAFKNLGPNVQFLSLCYAFFPVAGKDIFKGSALVGLDISGNPYSRDILGDPFEGITDTLKYLFLEESNLKTLEWLKTLPNLRLLSLRGNYINDLSPLVFENMRNLRALDLSDNLIGNWYAKIFKNNTELRLLNLRQNGLNMINSVMVEDFSTLDYLSLGNNNFICDCVLRDLMEVATINNKNAKFLDKIFSEIPDLLAQTPEIYGVDGVVLRERLTTLNMPELDALLGTLSLRYEKQLEKSIKNLRSSKINLKFPRMRYIARNGLSVLRSMLEDSPECDKLLITGRTNLNGTKLKFQLMDYDNACYWCFNGTNRMDFVELDCNFSPTSVDIAESINHLTRIVVISICSIMSFTLLLTIAYLKRWHIYYYYSSLKSAALLSVATKDQVEKFNNLSEKDPNMVYDLFISYCQSDREWVLKELLPNVEEVENISICLHERDFEIGVAILENIISCMDRSRALMLIISSNFLLSHWCQFEMHLAQHRIFEVNKEHLIVVFLEDIPRAKRPKSLQYLMEVKTYIKWPGAKGREVTPEERKCFWKRMRNSLYRIGVSPVETNA